MKKLLIKLLFFVVLIGILDFVTGAVLRYVYFKQNHGGDYATTYVMDKTTADILILGSSRANHHYISGQIQDSLHLSCYNAGRDGNFILFHYAVLQAVLKRYTPKIVILDLLDDEFDQSQDAYDRLSNLLPYYKTHPEIRSTVELRSPFERYKLLSGIYPFNSMVLRSISGALDLHDKRAVEDKLDGYVPLEGTWEGDLKVIDTDDALLDQHKINAYIGIIDRCKKAGVRLYIVISPAFQRYRCPDRTAVLAKDIADKAGVPFWSFLGDSAFLDNRSFFKDNRHLNNTGASLFTNLIIQKIK